MTGQITRLLKPEEEELLRKRTELAIIRSALAERELELIDFRSELSIFEGRYLREVGTLYAELDDWNARISELKARLDPSAESHANAQEARDQARQTYGEAHSESKTRLDFTPSADLKKLYRDVAKLIHPDFSKNALDQDLRTGLMAEANKAYQEGDTETLQRILSQQECADTVEAEGVGAELIRIIRQISAAKSHIGRIEQELTTLGESETALLKKQASDRQQSGGDLLSELATAVLERIQVAKVTHEELSARGTASA